MAICKGCGQEIKYIKTPLGKYMPVDSRPLTFEPDEEGNEVLVDQRGKLVRCVILPRGATYDPLRVGFRSHFGTCPAKEQAYAAAPAARQRAAPRAEDKKKQRAAPEKSAAQKLYYGGYEDGLARYGDMEPEEMERRLERVKQAAEELRGTVGPQVQLYTTGRKIALAELIAEREGGA